MYHRRQNFTKVFTQVKKVAPEHSTVQHTQGKSPVTDLFQPEYLTSRLYILYTGLWQREGSRNRRYAMDRNLKHQGRLEGGEGDLGAGEKVVLQQAYVSYMTL